MLDQHLKFFDIKPQYEFNSLKNGHNLSSIAGTIIMEADKIISQTKPRYIFIQGDTATAFASALAGFYNKIPVVHIEAGLRSFNKHHPFPEEINRTLIGNLADYHFVPTQQGRQNLINEGVDEKSIVVSGNTVIDTLLDVSNKINEDRITKSLPKFDQKKKLILVTAHRRENHGEGLERIIQAIKHIASVRNDVEFVFPVHHNPKIKDYVSQELQGVIHLTDTLDYPSMVYCMQKSYIILTDSGGLQEEATAFAKPVLVMRETTERMEGVDVGVAKLVGTDTKQIISTVDTLLDSQDEYYKMARKAMPYGDGHAADIILNTLGI